MLGDFNINYKFNNIGDGKKLKQTMATLGFDQLIKDYTHFNPNGEPTIIDLIFTNSPHVKASGIITPGLSDHEMVYMTREHTHTPIEKLAFTGRSYMNYDTPSFSMGIKNSNWEDLLNCKCPEKAWNMYIKQLSFLLEITCPIKEFKFKQKMKPWLDRHIITLIKDKNYAVNKHRRTQDIDDGRISDYLEGLVREACRDAKKGYFQQKFDNNKKEPKDYWKAISELVNPRPTNVKFNLINQDNKTPVQDKDTSDFINTFFAEIGSNLAKNMTTPWTFQGHEPDSSFSFVACTEADIIPLIKRIKVDKSSGITHISTKALKDAMLAVPFLVTHIVNLVIKSCTFPKPWKKALVSPLPKGGDAANVSNLRPISILPLPSKITEKIMHKQIITYLNEENLLNENQDGFRPNRSTINSLTKLTDNIYRGLNIEYCTTAIFLDFKKAFDTLDHKILAKKAEKIGFDQRAVALVSDYLNERKQCTKANGVISSEKTLTCGVPQGSVLGPLLFLLYINDMNFCLDSLKCQHYADDTVIYLDHSPSDNTIERKINLDLEKISKWCLDNKLSLNTKKTKAMNFSTKALDNTWIKPTLTINNDIVEFAPTYKYLGMTLDSKLTFKKTY